MILSHHIFNNNRYYSENHHIFKKKPSTPGGNTITPYRPRISPKYPLSSHSRNPYIPANNT